MKEKNTERQELKANILFSGIGSQEIGISTTRLTQHHKLKEKSKGICQQVPFFMLKYRQGCI